MDIVYVVMLGIFTSLIINKIGNRLAKGGKIGDIASGILGSLEGAFLANLFFGVEFFVFSLQSVSFSLCGAIGFLCVQRLFASFDENGQSYIS